MERAANTIRLEWTTLAYRSEGDLLGRGKLSLRGLLGGGSGGGLGGVEFAEDGDVGILVEMGIWLKAGFGV